MFFQLQKPNLCILKHPCKLCDHTFIFLGMSGVFKRGRECEVLDQVGQGCDVVVRGMDCEAEDCRKEDSRPSQVGGSWHLRLDFNLFTPERDNRS